VDKTREIFQLITTGSIYFLSRPRRFGKSLLISTMEAVFKGRQYLFEGLYIYDKWDWTKRHPVIRIDFGGLSYGNSDELKTSLLSFIDRTARNHQLSLRSTLLVDKFYELIDSLHASTGQRVVVLIDEYDKPIIDHMTNREVAHANRDVLRYLYQVLKAADEHLRFVFLTGVTKFGKLSVFSGMNSPNDITVNRKYATVCGYTQAELESNFSEHIERLALDMHFTKAETLETIRDMYNGYSWDGQQTVYNPCSTLSLFDNGVFSNYWYETGTPGFLIQLLKDQDIQQFLQPVVTNSFVFSAFDIDNPDLLSSLVQTGFLTVKSIDSPIFGEPEDYTLGIPNKEVHDSLLARFISSRTAYPEDRILILGRQMQQQIRQADAAGLEQNLRLLLAHIPYPLHLKHESYYHSLFLSWMKMLGFDIQGEVVTNIGRIDAVWQQPGLTIVAEVKYSSEKDTDILLHDALAQIQDRRYYEKYADKQVLLMAVAFAEKDLKCRIEPLVNN
jgi:hypothetical protein